MGERLKRFGVRQAGTFVMIAAIVAVSVVMIGRELGIGRQAAAVPEAASAEPTAEPSNTPPATSDPAAKPQEAEPEESSEKLKLTLEANPYCETGGGMGFSGSVFEYDDDGNPVGRTDVDLGYGRVAETQVRWAVSGGTAPYHLTIDNEPRDGRGPYAGATGVASVSCAPNPGKVFYDDYEEKRRYREDPQIDSGLKTIHAIVTDAAGATAAESIDIYVVLQLGGAGTMRGGEWHQYRLNAGKTYRYEGHLFTVPESITILPGDMWEADGGGWGQVLHVAGSEVEIHINRHGEEIGRFFARSTSLAEDAISGPDHGSASINEALDRFIASRGKPPTVNPNE